MSNKAYTRQASDGTLVNVLLSPNGDGTFSESAGGGSASNPASVGLRADARQGKMSGGLWTLGSASIVESVAVPDSAIGFRLRPTADTRFAINEDPVASGTETLTTGNTAIANETEVRLLEPTAGRTLRLLTTVAGSTVGVGFF